jgi:putative endopeptidase
MAASRRLSGFLAVLSAAALLAADAGQTPAMSGLDFQAIDPDVRPQDDLYRHANGRWLARTSMPPDRVSYGAFTELAERAEADLHAIILDAARTRHAAGSARQQIADLFASQMNGARIDALGTEPIRPDLARLDAIRTASDVASAAGHLGSIDAGAPFAAVAAADADHPGWFLVQLSPGGILLPSRDHYLRDDAADRTMRSQYEDYLTRLFALVGRARPAEDARAVLSFETSLSAAMAPAGDAAAAEQSPPYTIGQLRATLPEFDWQAWTRLQGLDRQIRIVLKQPAFFTVFARMVPETPIETLRAWLLARFVTASAPYLSQPFVNLRFEFFGRTLTGQEQPRERWKVGVGLVSRYLGDALGRLYVERHFPPRAKAGAAAIVSAVIRAQREAVQAADWLPPAARTNAVRTLDAVTTRIGYPSVWRDYRGLEVRPDDLFGNVRRAHAFDTRLRSRRVGGAADREEWTMTPQSLNAFYDPALNEIVLPAAFLQPPIFSADADAAVNYGALGAAVGHEISHALDPRLLEARAGQLIDQFNAFSPLPGAFVNGRLTLDENQRPGRAAVAYRAYQRPGTAGRRRSSMVSGTSASARLGAAGDADPRRYLRQWVVAMPHAPPEYRANVAVSHLAAFHDAFNVSPADRMYRAPAARVRIW